MSDIEVESSLLSDYQTARRLEVRYKSGSLMRFGVNRRTCCDAIRQQRSKESFEFRYDRSHRSAAIFRYDRKPRRVVCPTNALLDVTDQKPLLFQCPLGARAPW